MDPLWVVFEGPDGSGKTTQAKLFAQEMQVAGHDKVLVTGEPTREGIGACIRELLKSPSFITMPSTAQAMLYSADRAVHMMDVIAPALEKGAFVVSDRYELSTLIYQCMVVWLEAEKLGIDPWLYAPFISMYEWLTTLQPDNIEPALTFVLWLPEDVQRERLKKRRASDSFDEYETLQNALRKMYAQADEFIDGTVVFINGDGDEQTVLTRVMNGFLQAGGLEHARMSRQYTWRFDD